MRDAMSHRQLNLPPVPVQSVSRATEAVSLERETTFPEGEQELSLTRLLADCVSDLGCAEKDAARTLGYEPSYWSRIKAGEKAAHLDRVTRLPAKVQQEFVKRWATQLKMRVSDEDSTKRAIVELARAAVTALEAIA